MTRKVIPRVTKAAKVKQIIPKERVNKRSKKEVNNILLSLNKSFSNRQEINIKWIKWQ